MKITILGGTGPTGRQLISQALAGGHEVTALVRDATRLELFDPGLTVVTGDATDPASLVTAFTGAQAVISALGGGSSLSSDVASRAAAAIVPAAATTGVSRVIIMSAFGVGASIDQARGLHRLVINAVMKKVFADKARGDDAIRASDLDWTVVYPVTLSNGPRTGSVEAAEQVKVTLGSRISRADVAGFLIEQVSSPAWSRRTVIITTG